MKNKTHEAVLSHTIDDDGIWLNCSCGISINLGYSPSPQKAMTEFRKHIPKPKPEPERKGTDNFIGKYVIDKKVRKRIIAILDHDPIDRSVGIFHGNLTVETSDGEIYNLNSNGNTFRWVRTDGSKTVRVGKGGNVYSKAEYGDDIW